jgi:hypothetical protein
MQKNIKNSILRLAINSRIQLALLFIVWLIAVASRFIANGMSFSFDYNIFQPDGVLYALRTYMFLGEDQLASAKLIESWYFTHASSGTHFDPESILPQNNPAWGLVAPRILYPLLSIPFVSLFGMVGLLVIPSLSLLLLVFCIYFIAKKYAQPNFGLVLGLTILMSPTVLRWMVANITDSLFVGLFALVCLVFESKRNNSQFILMIGFLIILTSLTRFATPIWLALALVDFVKGKRVRSLFISVTSLIATIPTYLTQPSNSVLPREGELTTIEKLLALPESFGKILFFEVAQLAVLDRLLLIILALALILSLKSVRNDTSLRFLAVLLSVWAIGALNGSIGVNFRYQLPVISFACAVLIAHSNELRNWFFGAVRNIKRKEAQ